MHVHLCVALWLTSLHPSPFSTLFRCSSSGPSRCLPQSSTRGSGPTPCATSAWGPWPLQTTETPLTGYEPNKDLNLVNTEELDLAATSDIYWQHTLDDDASLNDPNVDDNQLAKYLAVVVESTGKPAELRSSNDQFSCDTRNLKGAQNQFPVVSQTEMICQTGGSVQVRIAGRARKSSCTD